VDVGAGSSAGDSVLRHSGFVGPSVMVTRSHWYAIADLVWKGRTLMQACKDLGLDWRMIDRAMPEEVRSFYLDVAMVAGAREECLGASNNTD
jgi:hypothetical protein